MTTTNGTVTSQKSTTNWKGIIDTIISRYGLLVVGLAMIALFGILKPDTYLTTRNLLSIATSQSIVALMALSILGILVVGEFDLSFSSIFGFSQVFVIGLIAHYGFPWWASCLLVLGVGLLAGGFNWIFSHKLQINSLVATLGLATILGGIAVGYSGGTIVTGRLPSVFTDIGRSRFLSIEMPIFYVLIIAAALYILLEYTVTGRHMRAVGDNRNAASLAGINVGKAVFVAFALAGVISVLAAIINGSQLGAGQPLVGAGYLLPSYAAVFLGATTVTPGRWTRSASRCVKAKPSVLWAKAAPANPPSRG